MSRTYQTTLARWPNVRATHWHHAFWRRWQILSSVRPRTVSPPSRVRPRPDVSGDSIVSPLDALLVVNYLRQPLIVAAGEGEGEGIDTLLLPLSIVSTGHQSKASDTRPFDETIDRKSSNPIDNFGLSPAATLAVNCPEPTPQETEEDMLSLEFEAALQLIAQDTVQQRMAAGSED